MSSVKELLRGDVIDGSGTANYIPKFIDTNTIGNSAIYESSGNIGIGTTVATSPLTVSGVTPSDQYAAQLQVKTDTINASDKARIGFYNSNHGTAYIESIYESTSYGSLAFGTRGGGVPTERMRIDASGNVGIGVTPAAWNSTSKVLQVGSLSSLSQQHNGSVNLLSNAYESGQSTFSNLVYGYAGRYNIDPNTGVHSWYNSALTNSGAPTTWLERMRITSGGEVLIGTTTLNQNGRVLNVKANGKVAGNFYRVTTDTTDGVLECQSDVGGTGSIKFYVEANGDVLSATGSYGTISSDVRLKENINSATSKLDDILNLNVVNYNYIGNDQKQIGFIAQEFEQVFPSLVDTRDTREYDEDGNVIKGLEDQKGLKVGMEFAILTKAIQEQQEIINDLKARIETLENK